MNNLLLFLLLLSIVYISILSPFTILMLPHQRDIEMKSWTPKSYDHANSVKHNDFYLDSAQYVGLGDVHGPESMAFSKNGKRLYFALKSGEIRYIDEPLKPVDRDQLDKVKPIKTKYLTSCGRALGITIDNDDNVIIADSLKGLLKFDIKTNQLIILTSTFKNNTNDETLTKLHFINDVVVGKDDMIYFTDSSDLSPILDKSNDWNTLIPSIYTIMAASDKGKLLKYNPITKETTLLMNGLMYANGVSFDSKEESIFVAETTGYSIHRYWIKGVNKGKSEIFIDNLPGYPDGIDVGSDDKLYISIFGGRRFLMDLVHPFPILKNIYSRIPFIKLPISLPSIVVVDTNTARILHHHQATSNTPLKSITSTIEQNGKIYIGNLLNNFISIIDIKKSK